MMSVVGRTRMRIVQKMKGQRVETQRMLSSFLAPLQCRLEMSTLMGSEDAEGLSDHTAAPFVLWRSRCQMTTISPWETLPSC